MPIPADIDVDDIAPVQEHVTDGVTTAFPFSFFAELATDVELYWEGLTLPREYGLYYTVTLADRSLGLIGGTVNLLIQPPSPTNIRLVRNAPVKRTTDFPTGGPLRAASLNNELDNIVAMIQQVEYRIENDMLTIPRGTPNADFNPRLPIPGEGKYLQWQGNQLVNSDGTVTAPTMGVDDYGTFPSPNGTLQVRRGTNTERNAVTLASGELGWDTTRKRFVVGDGITAGGIPIGAQDRQDMGIFTPYDFGGQPGVGFDNQAVFVAAQTAIQGSGFGGKLWIPPGVWQFSGSPFHITNRFHMEGVDFTSILQPTGDADWVFDVEETWRDGGEGPPYDTVNFITSTAGVAIKNLRIVGDRSLGLTQNGLRTTGRVDWLRLENVWFEYLAGTAVELGVEDAVIIPSDNALAREFHWRNVRIAMCGDAGAPPLHIDTKNLGDGTNQIRLDHLGLINNFGDSSIIESTSAGNFTRRIILDSPWIHGRNDAADAPASDVLTIQGGVQDCILNNASMNGSHYVAATNYACVRVKSAGGLTPRRVMFPNVNVLNCEGSLIVIENVQSWMASGAAVGGSISLATASPGPKTGFAIEVKANAYVGSGRGDISGFFGTDDLYDLISIDPTVQAKTKMPWEADYVTTANLADITHFVNALLWIGKRVYASDAGCDYVWGGTVWRPTGPAFRKGATKTFNADPLADGDVHAEAIVVTGVTNANDWQVSVSTNLDISAMEAAPWGVVTNDDEVTVYIANRSGGLIDMGSQTFEVHAWHWDSITPV